MSELITRQPADIERKNYGSTAGGIFGAVIVAGVMSWLPESAAEIESSFAVIVEWAVGVAFIGASTFVGGYVTRSNRARTGSDPR